MSLDLLSVVPAAARYERQPLPDTENALAPWTAAIHHFRDREDQDRVCSELIYGTEDGQPVEMPQRGRVRAAQRSSRRELPGVRPD